VQLLRLLLQDALLATRQAPCGSVALLGQRTGGEALPRGRDALQVAGIFALLAHDPRGLPGVFELAIGHKAAMAITALTSSDAVGASDITFADGLLTAALLAAYALTRGWTAWRRAGSTGDVDTEVAT
jgi:hypothetical protein